MDLQHDKLVFILMNCCFYLENHGQIPPRTAEVREIYGIVGILHLLAGNETDNFSVFMFIKNF